MPVPVGVTGVIQSGPDSGRFVRVVDDATQSGGLLVLVWWADATAPKGVAGFDDWLETIDHLDQYWSERGWKVEFPAPTGGVSALYD
jgi:hypothetical protein